MQPYFIIQKNIRFPFAESKSLYEYIFKIRIYKGLLIIFKFFKTVNIVFKHLINLYLLFVVIL